MNVFHVLIRSLKDILPIIDKFSDDNSLDGECQHREQKHFLFQCYSIACFL